MKSSVIPIILGMAAATYLTRIGAQLIFSTPVYQPGWKGG